MKIEEKEKINNINVIAIHREKLLFPSEQKAKAEKSDFVRSHFKEAWEFAEYAVIGIKQRGNQHKSCHNSRQFHTPKVFIIFEKSALYQRKDEQ